MSDDPHKRRPALRRAAFLLALAGIGVGIWQVMVHPGTPLQPAWNPTKPLNVADPFTSLTKWKLTRALAGRDSCLAALGTGAVVQVLPDFEDSPLCYIRPQVDLVQVGNARLAPLKTRCQTALRLAMWERHGIQPAAQRHLGQGVQGISHFSSYNCREMRTGRSGPPRMSTHATADAIDVSGFTLADGDQITLIGDWNGTAGRAAFLRDVRDSACEWFRVTLSPDYNNLHADHFHLQHTGWGLCR
jgi:hypothetical protein